ncbi:hypothetical protein D1AOALGA4SA_4068 [Olavius algarvensis Delta 1 endosymbiont]|nr:hypothetical protein D1AOALGA4SA_4068 [Olavius algarvensis Delta 1 endosymbiont]
MVISVWWYNIWIRRAKFDTKHMMNSTFYEFINIEHRAKEIYRF